MTIAECTEQHLPVAAELFNAYRMFYEQESDIEGCHTFLKANVEGKRSRIFLMFEEAGKAVGFSQLYPSQCSISMRPYWYLSDLYVEAACRKNGYATRLMNFITDFFQAEGASRLTLDTSTTNIAAQRLYESLGYERERVYITYHQHLE